MEWLLVELAKPATQPLAPWTSNSFAVFLEGDPAGLPSNLKQVEGGSPPLRGRGRPAPTPAWKRGFSLTSEQLEASRAERMRLDGHGTLTLEYARTWIEETGLCLFLPKRQFSTSIAPSFVEAVAGKRDATPAANILP